MEKVRGKLNLNNLFRRHLLQKLLWLSADMNNNLNIEYHLNDNSHYCNSNTWKSQYHNTSSNNHYLKNIQFRLELRRLE
ncbi:hypothetical protein D9Q81_00625 [Candidatus Korarchaeum cryptofilum]|uniref:Uncharacterized protein n=1 Tax=Candidatus Korarchaeum cryptofilum TaxID=498846 RepID=A0A429G9T2_9CREN|nr:hypothetical protein D9Q81_00625 [Candidatus Korarchaeum cryptofilum]